MPFFSYTATSTDGRTVSGTLDAESLDAARSALADMQLQPVEILESAPMSAISPAVEAFTRPSPVEPVAEVASSAEREPLIPPEYEQRYAPLLDTLRLYAGWLLAWYSLVYAFGWYQSTRSLPFTIPYLRGIFESELVLSFTLASFLFLLLSSVHRLMHGGLLRGFSLMVFGIVAFGLYRVNV